MGLFSENTSLLYLSILIIPVLSVVLTRKHVSLPGFVALPVTTKFNIVTTVSLFSGTAFSVLLILIPLSHDFSTDVVLSLLGIALLFSIGKYHNKLPAAVSTFAGKASLPARMAAAALIISFFAVVHVTALIFLGSVLVGEFVDGSLYLFVVVNIVVAGFVVLIGDWMTTLVNNAILGFLSLLTLLSLLVFPETISMFTVVLKGAIRSQPGIFFANGNNVFFLTYAPVGLMLQFVWIWWIDQYLPQQHSGGEREITMNGVTTFFLFITIASLLLLFSWSLRSRVVPFIVSESRVFALPVISLFSFLFLGSLFHSFSMVKMFSSQISIIGNSDGTVREKDILAGRLAVAGAAIISILLFPFAKMIGSKIVAVNLAGAACFIIPLISIFFLSLMWKGLTRKGISAGIIGGLVAGGVMFLMSLPAILAGSSLVFDPALMAVISLMASIVSSSTVSLVAERTIKTVTGR